MRPRLHGGRPGWEKRRRVGAGLVLASGNRFLRWTGHGIRMNPDAGAWQARELESFRLLHGRELGCGELGPDAIWTERLPGTDLRALLAADGLTRLVMRAAGEEIARAHALTDPATGSPWSHGAPHLGNVLFDAEQGRARLIDFETEHDPARDAVDRHADDLLSFLLDLLGRAPDGMDWVPLASSFVLFGGVSLVRKRLMRRLFEIPEGRERWVWQSRSRYLPWSELERRVARLRESFLV